MQSPGSYFHAVNRLSTRMVDTVSNEIDDEVDNLKLLALCWTARCIRLNSASRRIWLQERWTVMDDCVEWVLQYSSLITHHQEQISRLWWRQFQKRESHGRSDGGAVCMNIMARHAFQRDVSCQLINQYSCFLIMHESGFCFLIVVPFWEMQFQSGADCQPVEAAILTPMTFNLSSSQASHAQPKAQITIMYRNWSCMIVDNKGSGQM